ncbi:hypothetical protein AB4099_12485 [Bosea sp. 2KB_26]|uniref:hypothetical protein n=1 Tax=Bosea sp. 2KB_26 TaxID=3237475 RepID=UPI003F8E1D07
MESDNEAGILHGYDAIAAHIGIGTEAARYRVRTEGMPLVKSGRRVWIRKVTLDAWPAECEAKARQPQEPPPFG